MYASLVLFIGGAIVATVATSFSTFLIGRALWGAAAAGPRTVSLAITRDAYDGDIMSRIMSLTTAVFLIVPVLAPALGEGLLQIGSWRLTTMAAVILGAIDALWLTRLRETLAPEDVLPLEFGRVGRAARAVLTNRSTVLFTIATTLSYGAFFPWLGSSTQMIGEIYGRDDQFALFFGLNAAFMALVIVIVERLVKRYSTIPVLLAQSAILIFVAGAYVVWTAAGDGVVNFWGWFALVSVMTALNSGTTPLMQTLSLEPMGKIAGSSVTGAIVFMGGALLGAIIDRATSDTVTPFGVGFLVYSGLALASMLFARSGERL
jgi:DHA1 family bicyclomycin/chloramphenicol resistance-like MFS transporter